MGGIGQTCRTASSSEPADRLHTLHTSHSSPQPASPVSALHWSMLWILLTPWLILADQLPFQLREEWRREALAMIPVDINNDRVDELAWLTKDGGHLNITDQNDQFLMWSPPPEPARDIAAADIDRDGQKEIVVSIQKGWEWGLCVLSPQVEEMNLLRVVSRFPVVKKADWGGEILAMDTVTVGNKRNPGILIVVMCGLSLQPRGVAAYDPVTGKESWHYWMGPFPSSILIEDITDDDKPEIIIGTYAIHNGSRANNTDDHHSYIIVLDQNGELLYQKEIDGYWTGVVPQISDLDLDGKKEIVFVQYSLRAEPAPYTFGPDRLSILDAQTGVVKREIRTGKSFWGLVLKDINHDTRDEIITGNSDGRIRVFDSELNELMGSDIGSGVELWAVVDIDGDGRQEFVTSTQDSRVVILNERLKCLAELKLPYSIGDRGARRPRDPIKIVQDGRRKKLLLRAPDHQYCLYSFHPMPFITRPRGLLLPLTLGLLALAFFLLYTRQTLSPAPALLKGLADNPRFGILWLSRRGRVRFVNDPARSLLGLEVLNPIRQRYDLLLNREGLEPLLNSITTAFGSKISHSYEKLTIISKTERVIGLDIRNLGWKGLLIQLEDLSSEGYARKLEAWAPVAQRLAHGVKNPLSHIRLSVQQLRRLLPEEGTTKEKANHYSRVVLEQVDRLIKIVDGFMRFSDLKPPRRSPTRLNELIESLLNELRPVLPKGVDIEFAPADDLPPLNLDQQQIRDALMSILDNAFTAVGSKGTVTIRTTPIESVERPPVILKYVEIMITDTGPGMPEEYTKRLFEPYFTTKPEGTGLGLCIAKKIIEDHGGTISIDSKPDLGTTVIIRLPVEIE